MHQFNAYYGECTKFGRKKGNQSYNQIIRFCYFRNLATSQGLMQSKAACRTCTAIQGAWHPACERQSRMRDLFSRCPMAERLPLFSYFRNSPEEQYKSQKSCAHIIKLISDFFVNLLLLFYKLMYLQPGKLLWFEFRHLLKNLHSDIFFRL